MKKLMLIVASLLFISSEANAKVCYKTLSHSSKSTKIKCPSGSKYTILHNSKGYYISGSGMSLTYFNSLDKVARFACSC
jgi:hypothetical protein